MKELKLNYIYGEDVDATITHIDFLFFVVNGADKNTQRGLWDAKGEIGVAVIGRDTFVFNAYSDSHVSYIAEKLNIYTEEAKIIEPYLTKLKEILKIHNQ